MKKFFGSIALLAIVAVPTGRLLAHSNSPSLTAQIGQTVTQTRTAVQTQHGQDVVAQNILHLDSELAQNKADYGVMVYHDLIMTLKWLYQATQVSQGMLYVKSAQAYFDRT